MARKTAIATEFAFTLPQGLIDSDRLHRQGKMRLATAKDELWVQAQPQVQNNPNYSPLVMLSCVITRLGSLTSVTPELLEGLVLRDIAYLREFYNRINQHGQAHVLAHCPQCNNQFKVELALSGES
ncbi:phage tail assembly protein [Pseudanabaenaceae cyanobacterium LEGE 13415]|nr:phage tail assembly protein [Pseudanabaenaceae cyanobacterium LEGE 13415]